jgi:peptidoglycan-associated lipoprotein
MISCNQVNLSDARSLYLRGEYYAAGEAYRNLYRNTPREQRAMKGVVAFEMAENYRMLNQSARAVTAYGNAIRYEYPDTMLYLHYAQMLHREGQYDEAVEAYHEFLKLMPGHSLGVSGLNGAVSAVAMKRTPARYVVKRMDIFNSPRGEFSPLLANIDETLYFTSSRDDALGGRSPVTGIKYNDLFFSVKNVRGEWQKPKRIETEINGDFDEGTPSITSDGEYMYYTFSLADEEAPTTPEIYYSRRVNGSWTAGQPLKIAENDSLSLFAHPAVSPSGQFLYFVSDMPGGYGGKDIWRAAITESREVLYVENLGPEINSRGNEMFPYVRNDTLLYFSSDGHPGMGGLDLFVANWSGEKGKWEVNNLKPPLNSSADDFGITFEQGAEKGFFSSNRDDARGYDHIYSFEYTDVNTVIEGFVVDCNDEFIPDAVIAVVGSDGSQHQFTTNRQGEYRLKAKRGVEYLFMASAEGFLNQKKSLRTASVEKDTLYYVDFEMVPYNKPVILENILYDFDRAALRPEAIEELSGLIALLNEHTEILVELSAHTDRKGGDDYNRQLSQRRAQSVVDYLAEHNIDRNRLSAVGYGKTQPKRVNKNIASRYDFLNEGDLLSDDFIRRLTPEQQAIADQINRRTEFRVIGLELFSP